MPTDEREQEELMRHLEDAVATLRNDLAKVEFWACAVHGFAQPVPEYDADNPMPLFDVRGCARAERKPPRRSRRSKRA
jgi:hypothetical protein